MVDLIDEEVGEYKINSFPYIPRLYATKNKQEIVLQIVQPVYTFSCFVG